MHGMRIKSHKNAFGTHDSFSRNAQWSPGTPGTFWQGLKPAPTVANVIVLHPTTSSAKAGAKAKTTRKTAKRKTKTKTRK